MVNKSTASGKTCRIIKSVRTFRINTVISFVLVLALAFLFRICGDSFALSEAFADEGYIGNNKIVIDGITYEDRESSFSKIETVTAPGFSTTYNVLNYSDSYTYSEEYTADSEFISYDIPEIGSIDGQSIVPRILCSTPSSSSCISAVAYSTATAIGEPVNGTYYKQTPLWQKVDYNGETYYVPVDDIHNFDKLSELNENYDSEEEDIDEVEAGVYNFMKGYYSKHNNDALATCARVYLDDYGHVKPEPKLNYILSWCEEHGVSESKIRDKLGISDDKTEEQKFVYSTFDKLLKRDGMSIEKICSWEVTSGSKSDKEAFSSWCKERWDERVNAMEGWMTQHVTGGNTALDACKLAVGGKEDRPDEYEVIIKWCNKHDVTKDDIEKIFSIDDEYTIKVLKKRITIDPNMDNGPSPYRIIDDFEDAKFHIRSNGNLNPERADPNKTTYIIIHGWNNKFTNSSCTPVTWPNEMAEKLVQINPSAQVLRLDWSEIACAYSPFTPTKWIDLMTDEAETALSNWGINKDKTVVIGFSLGGIVNGVLSKKLNSNIISLDPAASILDYKIDFDGNRFKTYNNKGACIIADASLSGSQKLMKTCREGYLIDYSGNPDSVLFTELYEYVDFVIDEAIADTIEHVIDEGVTYAVEKTISKNIKGRIRGVRMYKIANGQLKEVFIKNVEEQACKVVDGTVKYLPYICKYGLKEIKEKFVTYHTNVYKTYQAILTNPFYENKLSPADFVSRKGGTVPFSKLSKDEHGRIYTERDQPTNIKYLKVIQDVDGLKDKYTLYGNTQDNKLECKDNKKCVMYGHSHSTNPGINKNTEGDIFTLDFDSNNYTIKDFKNYEEPDKIAIPLKDSGIIHPDPNADIGSEPVLEIIKLKTMFKKEERVEVRIEGFTRSEIRGWVEVAIGHKNLLPAKKKEDPIQIR